MDNMLKKTVTRWQRTLSAVSPVSIGFISGRKRDLQRSFARSVVRFTLATLCFGSVQTHFVVGNDGCNCESQAGCSSCKYTKPHSILGNGLLDFLDKATGPIGPNFYRSRNSCSTCESGCDQGCGNCGNGFETSNVSSNPSGSFGSASQNYSSSSPSSHHPHDDGHQLSDNFSSGHSPSISPMPIPDPIASPPTKQIQTSPSSDKNKPGNPFLDEARNTPSQVKQSSESIAGESSRRKVTTSKVSDPNSVAEEFIQIPVSVSSPSLSLSPSIQKQEVVVKKTSIKPSPRAQYKLNPMDQLMQSMSTKSNDQVITAGSIERTKISEAQFAR